MYTYEDQYAYLGRPVYFKTPHVLVYTCLCMGISFIVFIGMLEGWLWLIMLG